VFDPLVTGAIACLLLAGVSYGVLRWSRSVRVGGDPGCAEEHFRGAVVGIMLAAEYFLAALAAWTSLLPLQHAQGPLPGFSWILVLTLLFAVVSSLVLVRLGQGGMRRVRSEVLHQEGTHPVGDGTADRYWKAGLFYVNRDDPALFVEKRFGLGYTLNFGHPGTWLLIAALILLPVIIRFVITGSQR
jgi:uncharacterized membrane protein